MTVAFQVLFLRRAQRDIEEGVAFRASHSAARATQWRNALVTNATGALEDDPHRYPAADEAADLELDLRELLFGRGRNVYRVLFTIDGESVYVHRVRHAAQDRLDADDI